MKLNNQKHSVALVSIVILILLVILASPASARPVRPAFSYENLDSPSHASIQFYDKSVPSNKVTERLWDFGDGHFSKLRNPRHTFDASCYSTSYPVTLTVKYTWGQTATITRNIDAWVIC